jgi:peptidoglycan/xylan/chitin deacetylase (PgdA/CDA1 family)
MDLDIDVAVTVDELLLWDGTPLPPGYGAVSIVDGMCRAFREHGIDGVYGFAHTAPVEDDPSLLGILDAWCAAGHHLGNHTHHHASLNWVEAPAYCADITRAERWVGEFVDRAPVRYFRHAMDSSGQSEAKRGAVEDFVRDQGYVTAPITAWFGDFAWAVPYERAVRTGDREAQQMLRSSFVDAAVANLAWHAEAGRRMFGERYPYIWLIHGTALAQDLTSEILARFTESGVRFVPLDEAMTHPANRGFSPASRLFRNHLQRYALAVGRPVESAPPEATAAVLGAAPVPGEDSMATYDEILQRIVRRIDGTMDWSWE